ncbi:hypothetical protein NEIRO03_0993 [Nematocida sp. AWRm78]|nr:hypothetical protein NEIRO02_0996 [Nematocida sp. AWRm79]KAI5183396.1 hypothetical protein NEIRO03_0993 [Nematocida sp. AWRm78]
MIIQLLLVISSIYARMPLYEIMDAQEILFGNENDLKINPNGSLNLLRGYVSHNAGYMHNKRFFSPEINIAYKLEDKIDFTENKHTYRYIRTPENDKPYDPALEDGVVKMDYLQKFHKMIIYMFPSENNTLSIEPYKSNSFTRFLRFHSDKPDSMYILSALLLLSEGIYVPIDIDKNESNGKMAVVLNNTKKTHSYINLDMHLKGIMPEENGELVAQTETEEIIEFFKEFCRYGFLPGMCEFIEPTTQDDFSVGNFLNSANFLIYSYIYEYIEDIHQYKQLVKSTLELLEDLYESSMEPSITPKSTETVKNSLFTPIYTIIAEEVLIKKFCEFKSKLDCAAIIPFINNASVYSYTRIPEHTQMNTETMPDETSYYNNHVETMLLNLFCTFTYNPEDMKHSTAHITNPSDALVRFFDKYSTPNECATQEMHRDWSAMISNLNNPNIIYNRNNGNALFGGLINILYVIYELTQSTDVLNGIDFIYKNCSVDDDILTMNIRAVSDYLQYIFGLLTVNRSLNIYSFDLTHVKRINDSLDICGKIAMKLSNGHVSSDIELDFSSNFCTFRVVSGISHLSQDMCDDIIQITGKYLSPNNYTGYIIYNYINNNFNYSTPSTGNNIEPISVNVNIPEITPSMTPNEIFLFGPIESLKYKSSILMDFLINNSSGNLPINTAMERFTENIIGSVSLNIERERIEILSKCICNLKYMKYYPKINYFVHNLTDFTYNSVKLIIIDIIQGNYPKQSVISSLYHVFMHPICSKYTFEIFEPKTIFLHLFSTLTKKYELSCLYSVLTNMDKGFASKDKTALNNIYLTWLSYACGNPEYSCTQIGYIYSFIDYKKLSTKFVNSAALNGSINFNEILSSLELEKDSLVANNEDGKEKYENIIKYLKNASALINEYLGCNPRLSKKRKHSDE